MAAFPEEEGPSAIRLTAGVVANSAEAVKQGVNKVSEALAPAPPVAEVENGATLATKAKPTPELFLAMARFYEQTGKPDQAEQAYRQALKLAPMHVVAALNYARFKDRQGLAREALEAYQTAVKLHPKEASVFNDLGLFYARQGKTEESLAAFERAVQLQPKKPLYRNNVGALLVDMNRPEKALLHLSAVYGEAEAHYKLGYLLQKKGQTREAAYSFAKALQINPSMSEARVWLRHLQGGPPPQAEVARRVIPESQPGPGPAASSPPHPSVMPRDDGPPVASGPRAGPRSATGEREPPQVRPLPPLVKRLPSPHDENRAKPAEVRPSDRPPLPDDIEPESAAPDPPLPEGTPDAPLPSEPPSESKPRRLPPTD